VGYLLFPLHRKARLGGLFCFGPTDPHCLAQFVARMTNGLPIKKPAASGFLLFAFANQAGSR
jgi:hypothetical protein